MAVWAGFRGGEGFGIARRIYRILGWCISQGGALPGRYEYIIWLAPSDQETQSTCIYIKYHGSVVEPSKLVQLKAGFSTELIPFVS